jgi:hypothetical protein
MKNLYKSLYISASVLFLISLLGGSLSKPLFNSISESALESGGLRKAYIHAADDKVDDLFHTIKKIEYQIERIKNIFSSEKVDESLYGRQQNYLIANNLYNPLIITLNYIFRSGLFLISLIIALSGVIAQLIYNGTNLRRRVAMLESIVLSTKN